MSGRTMVLVLDQSMRASKDRLPGEAQGPMYSAYCSCNWSSGQRVPCVTCLRFDRIWRRATARLQAGGRAK